MDSILHVKRNEYLEKREMIIANRDAEINRLVDEYRIRIEQEYPMPDTTELDCIIAKLNEVIAYEENQVIDNISESIPTSVEQSTQPNPTISRLGMNSINIPPRR